MILLQLDDAELDLKCCGFSKLKDKMWPNPVEHLFDDNKP